MTVPTEIVAIAGDGAMPDHPAALPQTSRSISGVDPIVAFAGQCQLYS
jgi:hypothetical protein